METKYRTLKEVENEARDKHLKNKADKKRLQQELKRLEEIADEEKKQQKTKSRVAKALVLAPPSSSGSSSRGSVSTGSNPGIIGYFGIAWGGYKTRTK